MTATRALGQERLQRLIDFIVGEGWEVIRTRSGHVEFTKDGLPPIYTGTTALARHSVRARPGSLNANRTPAPATPALRVRTDD